MTIILIPCSGSKVPGGQPNFQPSKLTDRLSPATFKRLMEARQEIEVVLKKDRSLRFGFKDNNEPNYLPAFRRYQGLIYTHSDITRLYPAFKGQLIIVSALYGLVDGNDVIRNYELSMKDTLPTGMKVHTFWRQHGLRDVLIELVGRDDAVEVHDLLSGHYREALRPWPDSEVKNYHPYEYPGLGQGSSFARARNLKKLLSL